MFYCIGKKFARILISSILAVAVLAISVPLVLGAIQQNTDYTAQPVANYEWGLSFQKKGEPPVPNLEQEKLLPYNTRFSSGVDEKVIYLTFDCGYENGNTLKILEALRNNDVKAAFFVVGTYITECPDLVKLMLDDGHIVANHTYHHPDMRQKGKEGFAKELTSVEEKFKEAMGRDIDKYYRPPMGKFNEENLTWAKEMGYKTILWSLAYADWDTKNQPDKAAAVEKIMSRTHNGAIVLLHQTSSTNAAILDELIKKWKEQGYTFGSLNDLKFESTAGA